MAFRKTSSVFLSGYLGSVLLLCLSCVAFGQDFQTVNKTEEFTDFEYSNNRLHLSSPEYLMVTWENGNARYRVMEQEIVPVTADSSEFHYVENPDFFGIADRQAPLIEVGRPGYSRGQMLAPLTINIARQHENTPTSFEVVRHMRIRVYHDQDGTRLPRSGHVFTQATRSPLASGNWYKIPIPDDHIYTIDSEYLDELGIDVASVDPRNIQIWTTNGYELPRRNSDPRPELTEVPLLMDAESANSFDDEDRILFFANGPDRHFFNNETNRFEHRLHPFANENYIFLTIGDEPGLRLTAAPSSETPTRDVNRFRDFRWLEEDREKSESRLKSGMYWFGQPFSPSTSASIFTDTLAGYINGSDVDIRLSMAARSESNSQFQFNVNGYTGLPGLQINRISSLTASTGPSARVSEWQQTLSGFSLDNGRIDISASYNNPRSSARGWVNWVQVRADRNLQASNNRLRFHPPEDGDGSMVRYQLTGFDQEPVVLDITDPVAPILLETRNETGDGNFSVIHSSERTRQFLASSNYAAPPPGEAIPNQNLKNPDIYPDYVIITDESLLDQARRLADYRQSRDGLTPVIATQEQIFNEFNGGVPDFVALRDYLKYLYDRGDAAAEAQPEYLLFLGDATYDYKGVIPNPALQNLVFTYQSEESVSRAGSYGSDDFFGFMGDHEGLWPLTGTRDLLDIGIGRLPVQTPEHADLLIDKIQRYENPRNRGDWNSIFTFIADDDLAGRNIDRDLHILNADGTAEVIDRDDSGVRLDKIYQISYPLESTSAGQRVPQATQAMINRINEGTVVFNFSGHGAEQFLTDQRLFTSDDIDRLNNRDRLSIMVTATCSFGRYDDTDDHSGAEKMLLHRDGGLIATMTTSRVVYTSPNPSRLNFGLNRELTKEMMRREENGRPQRLGDIYRKTKMTPVGSSDNSRKFILLGDPALRIGLPHYQAQITHINGNELSTDTLAQLRALDKVSVSGHVSSPDGSVNTSFDGEANVRVFDAKRLVSYPNRDWVEAENCYLDDCGYYVQTDALFNGRVSVSGGSFDSQFIIPKDVSFSENPGRIQVYARERDFDAVGATSRFRISDRNPDAEDEMDQSGPDIDIYMNDEMFTNGGIVNDSPTLIVLLSDDSGINTTGAGVGHEIVAIVEDLDNSANRQTISLNDFYQSNLDDFTSGRIEYPLSQLDEGHYRLRIRAWDVFNNMGESEITFQVLDSQDLQIRNVYNYPNPMHNFTHFVFEHNQPGNPMDITIRIYTLSGQPVTTIRREHYISAGNMVQLDWHGRDDDQHRLATGTYLYHVQVRTETDNGRQTEDKIERLVILQ